MKVIRKITFTEIIDRINHNLFECGTMIRTQRKNGTYDYYKFTKGDKHFHRCRDDGKLGQKKQIRFLNYDNFEQVFEIVEQEKDIEETKGYENFNSIDDYIEHLRYKIDELVRELNKIKKEGK